MVGIGRRFREELEPFLPELHQVVFDSADSRLKTYIGMFEAIPPYTVPTW